MKFLQLLLSALVCASSSEMLEQKCAYSDYRLPQHIRPEHYDLWLDVDTDKFTFKGRVGITVVADGFGQTTDKENSPPLDNVIVLHANVTTLAIDKVQFSVLDEANAKTKAKPRTLKVKSVCRYEHNELLVISLKEKFPRGSRGELVISFHGSISDDPDYLMGFYKNVYTNERGQKKAIVSTQFEAAAARKAFPCFDEPTFKATFDTTLVHDPKLVALSNAPIEWEQREQRSGRKITKYKRTPRMSTYLLAYAIGDLEHLEQVIFDGRLTIRAYTLPGQLEKAKFALETAVRAIIMMEEYFDVPFAMEKIDMVALPSFDAGAMENWGLIFYLDQMFLFDSNHGRAVDKGEIAATVVHELAHQWFGNLVTMSWWNDLWLNEGFASWMQHYITNQLYPELEWDQYYLVDTQMDVLNMDARPKTHPIQLTETGRDLDALFDDIVYKKSATLLKQIHDDYLGPERFREGVRLYIRRHVYGNTQASDLWSALKEASGLPVDQLIESWVAQAGHPVVEAQLATTPAEGGRKRATLRLKQSRHFLAQRHEANGQKWIIPLDAVVADDKGNTNTIRLVMDKREAELELPEWFDANNERHWIKLNAGFQGFYRVRYSRDLLLRLEGPCRSKALETADRLNVIFDVFSDTDLQSLSHADLADIFGWFANDYEGSVVVAHTEAGYRLLDLLNTEPTPEAEELYERIDSTMVESFKQIYNRRGFKIESNEPSVTDVHSLLLAFETLIRIGFKPVIRDALREFDANKDKGNVNLWPVVKMATMNSGSYEQKISLEALGY